MFCEETSSERQRRRKRNADVVPKARGEESERDGEKTREEKRRERRVSAPEPSAMIFALMNEFHLSNGDDL